ADITTRSLHDALPIEMDVRPGGRYRWAWRSDEDGKTFGFHGEFLEVDPPSRLVHSEMYEPGDVGGDMGGEATVTVTFEESGERRSEEHTSELQSRENL